MSNRVYGCTVTDYVNFLFLYITRVFNEHVNSWVWGSDIILSFPLFYEYYTTMCMCLHDCVCCITGSSHVCLTYNYSVVCISHHHTASPLAIYYFYDIDINRRGDWRFDSR